MKSLKKITLFAFILISAYVTLAQNFADKQFYLVDSLNLSELSESEIQLIDSCLNLYQKATNDTAKLELLNRIVEESWNEAIWAKYNFWISNHIEYQFNNNSISANKKRFYKKMYAGCLINTGYYYRIIGEIDLALDYYKRSYLLYDTLRIKEGLAYCLNNMGVIYDNLGNLEKALDSYHKSLALQEEINDKEGIANSLSNIGEVLRNQGEREKALEYFNKCIAIQKEINNPRGESLVLIKIAEIYRQAKEYEKAKNALEQSLKINQNIEYKYGVATSLRELGTLMNMQGKLKETLNLYNQSIKIFESIGDKEEIAKGYNGLSIIHLELKNSKIAKEYALKSFQLSKEMGFAEIVSASAKGLSSIYELENNTEKALEMYKIYVFMRDSVHNAKNEKLSIRTQMQYEYDKKDALAQAEQAKKDALANEEKRRQQLITYGITFGLVLVIVFFIILFQRFKVIRKQRNIISEQKQQVEEVNEELNQTNEEILAQRDEIERQKEVVEKQRDNIVASITYAKRIQEALLNNEEHQQEHLPEHFILFKPKDIVSGDFYWILEKDNHLYLAAVDCTGHGVPGAFLTMLGTSFLNEINSIAELITPAEILDKLRFKIVKELSGEGVTKDGMDISLIRINLINNEALWAGANNPLYILRNQQKEIEIIKADKQPIGYYRKPSPFTNQSIFLNSGDIIYLFTDGFADQFGGDNGRKLGYKAFRDLLVELQNIAILNQKDNLLTFFEDWKKHEEQLDDVCIIGIKI